MGRSPYRWKARVDKKSKCKKQNDRAKIKILNADEHAYSYETRCVIWDQYHDTLMHLIALATCCNNLSVLL